jgi:hypothetical protein
LPHFPAPLTFASEKGVSFEEKFRVLRITTIRLQRNRKPKMMLSAQVVLPVFFEIHFRSGGFGANKKDLFK